MTDDVWKCMEKYLDWKSRMVVATTYLTTAIQALSYAEFGLAGLKDYPELEDRELRQDVLDHVDRLREIRDALIKAQDELKENARKDLTGQIDGTEAEG